MNLQDKEQLVGQVSQSFSDAAATFIVDYRGCSCQALTELRKELRPSGATFSVVKNTLIRRAIEGTDVTGLDSVLKGPTAVVWTGEDPVAPAKVISKFAKAQESFSIKAGIVDGKVVDASGIAGLAELPSREELFSKLLSLINAPATKLLQTINEPAGQLVRLLGAWQQELEKKDG
ncbi:UNVERIFIED_CONTAM: hypothetical protein GTU68_024239 [Idotea baltica]|nr:hypothetical protein [Idotea baltica]